MAKQITILETQNEGWGFFGTMYLTHEGQAPAAWNIAFAEVAKLTGANAETVRLFLDSRAGRHFADDVSNHTHAGKGLEQAIKAAAEGWQGWKVGRTTARALNAKIGTPYLAAAVAASAE
jgi:hypothetical protein